MFVHSLFVSSQTGWLQSMSMYVLTGTLTGLKTANQSFTSKLTTSQKSDGPSDHATPPGGDGPSAPSTSRYHSAHQQRPVLRLTCGLSGLLLLFQNWKLEISIWPEQSYTVHKEGTSRKKHSPARNVADLFTSFNVICSSGECSGA